MMLLSELPRSPEKDLSGAIGWRGKTYRSIFHDISAVAHGELLSIRGYDYMGTTVRVAVCQIFTGITGVCDELKAIPGPATHSCSPPPFLLPSLLPL